MLINKVVLISLWIAYRNYFKIKILSNLFLFFLEPILVNWGQFTAIKLIKDAAYLEGWNCNRLKKSFL